MKLFSQLICLLTLFALSLPSSAGTIDCDVGSVKLTSVQLAFDDTEPPNENSPPETEPFLVSEDYSACEGTFDGNDKWKPSGSNIGEYGDGWLNGEHQGTNEKNTDAELYPYNTLFDPFFDPDNPDDPFEQSGATYNPNLAFITNPGDLEQGLQDLDDTDGNDDRTDPGWVYLGKDEGDGFGVEINDEGVNEGDVLVGKGLDGQTLVSSVVDINFSCNDGEIGGDNACTIGTWSIMPDWNIVEMLKKLFGDGVFDHLALVFKAGDEFAVYDFNFNTIEVGGSGLELTLPYNLSGTFDVSNVFLNPPGTVSKGISHISVWVRDPAFFKEIPEPKSAFLMLLAVILLGLRFKNKHTFL